MLSEPSEIVTLSGQKLPLRMSVGMCALRTILVCVLCGRVWKDVHVSESDLNLQTTSHSRLTRTTREAANSLEP